jgi:hypothetical protein
VSTANDQLLQQSRTSSCMCAVQHSPGVSPDKGVALVTLVTVKAAAAYSSPATCLTSVSIDYGFWSLFLRLVVRSSSTVHSSMQLSLNCRGERLVQPKAEQPSTAAPTSESEVLTDCRFLQTMPRAWVVAGPSRYHRVTWCSTCVAGRCGS